MAPFQKVNIGLWPDDVRRDKTFRPVLMLAYGHFLSFFHFSVPPPPCVLPFLCGSTPPSIAGSKNRISETKKNPIPNNCFDPFFPVFALPFVFHCFHVHGADGHFHCKTTTNGICATVRIPCFMPMPCTGQARPGQVRRQEMRNTDKVTDETLTIFFLLDP